MCWPTKVPCLRQPLELAVEQDVRVGQLAPALGREGEQRPGAALDVDPAVLARRAGQIVERVQLLLARHDRLAERLDHPRALVERELAQRRPADLAGVAQHPAEIDAAGAGRRHRRAVDRARDLGKRCHRPRPSGRARSSGVGGFSWSLFPSLRAQRSNPALDCRVATLLAMTGFLGPRHAGVGRNYSRPISSRITTTISTRPRIPDGP